VYSSDGIVLHRFQQEPLIIINRCLSHEYGCRPGFFSSALLLSTSSGDVTLTGLDKASATNGLLTIRTQLYQSVTKEVCEQADLINRFVSSRYLKTSQIKQVMHRASLVKDKFFEVPGSDIVHDEAIREQFKFVEAMANLTPVVISKLREKYLARELRVYAGFFDGVEKNPLTVSQRNACVIDEDNNLILAGAGTGKTSVMIGRVGYLIQSGKARPNDVLMLAFGRKAADEMDERIKERLGIDTVKASTFHALGLSIVAQVEGGKPSITPYEENEKRLVAQIDQWFHALLDTPEYRRKVLTYFDHYMYSVTSSFDFENEGSYFAFLDANNTVSMKQEMLKSLEECYIANFLFKMGVEYQYEHKYAIDTRTLIHGQYKPDFFLPEYDIYIEHFGIDRESNTAPYVNREKYLEGMEWKRETHRENETTLVETFHYELAEGVLLSALEAKLSALGVMFNPLPDKAVLETLKENKMVNAFSRVLHQVMKVYLSGCYDEARLHQRLIGSEKKGQVYAALEILAPIIDNYKADLSDNDDIDFAQMIDKAIEFKPAWKYILVDEFQDIAGPRVRLIKALRNAVKSASLFCVGDDWQSVYRFTGSDIAYTTEFENIFGDTAKTTLEKSFRFNSSIGDVASRFVMLNPLQIRKDITAHARVSQSAVSLVKTKSSEIENRLEEVIAKIASIASSNSSVLILNRFRFQAPKLHRLKKLAPNLDIKVMSAHGSKGKEAGFVIVMNMLDGEFGFPSEKITHPLVDALLPSTEAFEFAEERRLFYVALTRAKNRVYLLTDMEKASRFVIELIEQEYPIEQNEFPTSLLQKLIRKISCRSCHTGTMTLRSGKWGRYYGCCHYPRCAHTEKPCGNCNLPMSVENGYKMCIDPECNYRVPVCQKCGSDMVYRTGAYGEFWGCRNYRGNERVSCNYTMKSKEFSEYILND